MLDRREEDIVVAAQLGSKNAFGELVQRYQNLVTSIAFSRTGDLQRSEDIAQQAFLVAWEKRAELREPSRFGGWLRAITRNVTLNSNRKIKRLDRSAQTLEPRNEPASIELPEDRLANKEQQALLWASLKNIPEDYREPLILFYREDQSVQQVADQMGLSVDAVKQRLVRGRGMLKSEVEQFVEDLLGSTKPSASFASGVLAMLPVAGAATGKAVVQGGLALGAKSMLGKLGIFLSGPFLGALGGVLGGAIGVWGGWYGTKVAAKYATSEQERELLWWFFRVIVWITMALTGVAIAGAFLTSEGPTRLVFVVGISLTYTAVLIVLIFFFVSRQAKLHEQFGRPAYPESLEGTAPSSKKAFRFGVAGAAIGSWVWVFVLAFINRNWIILAIAVPVCLANLTWFLANADFQTTGPDQMRFQAKSVLSNSFFAAILVAIAGFSGAQLSRDGTSNWSISLAVLAICWIVAALIWYAAGVTEKKVEQKRMLPPS